MSYKLNLEKINQIETEFPIFNLECKGIKIWPIIRWQITSEAPAKREKYILLQLLLVILGMIKTQIIQSIYKIWDAKKNEEEKGATDIFFFCLNSDRRERINGKFSNKFPEALKILSKGKVNIKIFEYGMSSFKDILPRFNKSVMIAYELKKSLTIYYFRVLFGLNNKVKVDLEKLIFFIKKNKINLHFDEKVITRTLNYIFAYEQYFEKLLKKSPPKLVAFIYYPSSERLGLILACKKLGIKCMDMQHGLIHDAHPMYSNWKNLPNEGYKFHPNYFWMWGNQSAKKLKNFSKINSTKVFTGGNTWLAYSLNFIKHEPLFNFGKKYNKIVLVATQVISEFKESCIPEAIQENPSILWLIRLHPSRMEDMFELKKFLKIYNQHNNVEFEKANQAQLYAIFKQVDCVISFWSTVAYEAIYFKTKNIIVHEYGKQSMKDYIDKKIFLYATNAKELLNNILNEDAHSELEPFIDTQLSTIERAISLCVK